MRIAAGLAVVAVLVAACQPQDMPDQIEGARVYEANCAMCHGADGTGVAGVSPRAADLTRLARNNGAVFPTNRVLSQIDGYLRSEEDGMPEFGLLLEGDLVPVETDDGALTPTPRPLAALLEYLRTIQN